MTSILFLVGKQNMERLCAALGHTLSLTPRIINRTPFILHYDPASRAVISDVFIPQGSELGVIDGTLCYYESYTYDENQLRNFVIISWDEDFVIDVSHTCPKDILSQVRNGFLHGLHENCSIDTQRRIKTIANILPGDELIM
jgi:hypothetical protein